MRTNTNYKKHWLGHFEDLDETLIQLLNSAFETIDKGNC